MVEQDWRSGVEQVAWGLDEGPSTEALFEAMGAPVLVLDRDGRIVRCNRAFERFAWRGREDLLGQCVFDLAPDLASPVQLEALFAQADASESPVDIALLHPNAEGDRRVWLWSSAPVLEGEGPARQLIVTGLDITDSAQGHALLDRADRALREEHALTSALLETAPILILVLDPEGRVLRFNRSCEQFCGHPAEEMLGRPVWELPMLAHRADIARATVMANVAGNAPIGHESEWETRTGERRLIMWFDAPLLDEEGRLTHLISTGIDITEHRRAGAAVEESEARFRSLVEAAFEGIIMHADGILLQADATVAAMFGYTPEELVGTNIFDYLTTESQPIARAYSAQRSSHPYETWGRRKDGTTFPLEVCAKDTRYHGRDVRVAAVRDLSEQVQTRAELERSLNKLHVAMEGIVRALASTVETRDPYTAGHQRRVSELVQALAQRMQLPPEQATAARMAAAVHDIGKMAIPADLLSRPGRLNSLEWEFIRTHPEAAFHLLKTVDLPWPIAQIVLEHHERMDGSGYPRGLTGEEISLEARLLGVADVVEAMASHRPYRPAMGLDLALAEIAEKRQLLYDPAVADACLAVFADGFAFTD